MIFNDEYGRIIYTKDEYHKKYDDGDLFYDKKDDLLYYKGYLIHREDGPAEECYNGFKFWFQNGKLHREDGPAMEYYSGNKFWFKNGKRHREDGPAMEYSNGNKFWYLNDMAYSKYDYWKILNIKKKSRILNDI